MNTGSVLAQFTVTLTQAVSEPVAVDWYTSDGTAKAGVDYAANKGVVLFAPGEIAKTVEILVYGRAVGSEDRSFFVEMLPPVNAILGTSIGECIIHVDTTGSTPVTQIIVPTGPQGPEGKSAYQTWLDLGNTGSEQDFIDSLSPSPEEIAEDVAPLIDVGDTVLTAEGTEVFSKPDQTTVKAVARRVAYVGAAKIATVMLADGDNLIAQSDLTGDIVDMSSVGLYPRIMRGTAVLSPQWHVEVDGRLLIKDAVAGDVLYVCQYDTLSAQAVINQFEPIVTPIGILSREALRRSYAEAGLNLVPGSFELGGTLINATDILLYEADGKAYSYNGTLPHTVNDDSAPGDEPGMWIDKSKNIFGRNVRDVVHAIGKSASLIPANYDLPEINRFQLLNGSFAAGNSAGKITKMGQTIAIGGSAMGETIMSWENIAIGEAALMSVQGVGDQYTSNLTGSRNVAIGGNAAQFLTTGNGNVVVGRNAATSFINNVGATVIGAGAMAGGGANGGWTTKVENWFPNTTSTTAGGYTAIGLSAGKGFCGDRIVAIGGNAGVEVKRGNNNTLVGYGSGAALESDLLPNGHTQIIPAGSPVAATYVKTGANLVITLAGHSAVVGQRVLFNTTSGVAQTPGSHGIWETVLAADATTFTVNCPLLGDGSGNAVVYLYDTGVNGQFCSANVAMGTDAMRQAKTNSNNNTVMGHSAAYNIDGSSNNTVVGSTAGSLSTFMSATTLLGWNAGSLGAQGVPSLTQCTFVGGATGYKNIDNTVPASYTNVSIFGYGAVASGNNQVQLGNSATTTYVYGTVQNRSDIRDKADIQDTQLGIDFIMGLRPVDGRWDLRDDYVSVDEEGNVTHLEKDGSKKRKRLHHWFIAQDVKELCDSLGVEFGGYQDHSVNGCCDVLSLGYDEFIPPTVKAVQQCWTRLDELEKRIAALE